MLNMKIIIYGKREIFPIEPIFKYYELFLREASALKTRYSSIIESKFVS